jgi:hypothetical protein
MHEGHVFVVRRHSADEWWSGDGGPFGAPSGQQIECFWLCQVCSGEMRIGKDGELQCGMPFEEPASLSLAA